MFLATVLALASNLAAESRATQGFTFSAKEFLTLTLVADRDGVAGRGRAGGRSGVPRTAARHLRPVQERLSRDPGIRAVTYANIYPGRGYEFILDVEGMPQERDEDDPLWVRSPGVASNYFDALGVPILAGRNFTSSDLGRPVAIVDETFVRRVLGGQHPIGVRVRRSQRDSDKPGPWLEIVGVVRDLSVAKTNKTSEDAMLFRPIAPEAALPLRLMVRANGDGAQASATVRRATAETDPTLRVYEMMPLERIEDTDIAMGRFFVTATALVACVALVLATAGIYSLMSFTLTRRTREIGIRAALGAAPRRIVTALFSRTFVQVGIGALIGSVPGGVLLSFGLAETAGATMWTTLAGTAVSALFVLLVAMLTCVVPARRALRIQPTEALRVDG